MFLAPALTTIALLLHFPMLCSAVHYAPRNNDSMGNSSAHAAVSINMALNYSEETMYSPKREKQRAQSGRESPPGADTDPDGVYIYSSVDQVPTARLLGRSTQMQTCYAARDGSSRCWTAYVCGHRCEPVLLAINSFCQRQEAACRDNPTHSACSTRKRWIRCQKARKFNRCYARLCFRTAAYAAEKAATAVPKPVSYEDPMSVSIVRYNRPVRKNAHFL